MWLLALRSSATPTLGVNAAGVCSFAPSLPGTGWFRTNQGTLWHCLSQNQRTDFTDCSEEDCFALHCRQAADGKYNMPLQTPCTQAKVLVDIGRVQGSAKDLWTNNDVFLGGNDVCGQRFSSMVSWSLANHLHPPTFFVKSWLLRFEQLSEQKYNASAGLNCCQVLLLFLQLLYSPVRYIPQLGKSTVNIHQLPQSDFYWLGSYFHDYFPSKRHQDPGKRPCILEFLAAGTWPNSSCVKKCSSSILISAHMVSTPPKKKWKHWFCCDLCWEAEETSCLHPFLLCRAGGILRQSFWKVEPKTDFQIAAISRTSKAKQTWLWWSEERKRRWVAVPSLTFWIWKCLMELNKFHFEPFAWCGKLIRLQTLQSRLKNCRSNLTHLKLKQAHPVASLQLQPWPSSDVDTDPMCLHKKHWIACCDSSSVSVVSLMAHRSCSFSFAILCTLNFFATLFYIDSESAQGPQMLSMHPFLTGLLPFSEWSLSHSTRWAIREQHAAVGVNILPAMHWQANSRAQTKAQETEHKASNSKCPHLVISCVHLYACFLKRV